jgi:hypothetical protein
MDAPKNDTMRKRKPIIVAEYSIKFLMKAGQFLFDLDPCGNGDGHRWILGLA